MMRRSRILLGMAALRRRRRYRFLMLVLAGTVLLVTATSVAFGSYDPTGNSNKDGTGSVAVSCDASTAYTVAINAGNAGSFNRAMASGSYSLGYNLYTDATRTTVWGDGTGGTSRVSQTGTGATITVYGRIPAHQNVGVGSYTDTLVVTVQF
jgi:spore coat protein U-like protein